MKRNHNQRVGNLSLAIEDAVDQVLGSGYRTPDIAQPECRVVGCQEMGRLVRERL